MRRTFASIAFAAVAVATPAFAASLTAPLGQAVRIPIRGMASDVVVGDTKIADVTVVGPSTLFVVGRAFGSTNVVVVDASGRTLFDGRVMVPTPTAGEVTIYRGSEQSSVLCAPNCSPPLAGGRGGGAQPSIGDMLAGMMGKASGPAAPAPAPTAQ